jgi:hypothetical protein
MRDFECDTNSAAQHDLSSGLIGEEKGIEKGKYDRGAKGSAGDRRAGEGKGEAKGEKDGDNEGSSSKGAKDMRAKGREEEERKRNEGGILLAVGEREEEEDGEEEEEEEEEDYLVTDEIAESVTDTCALYITAVRKDYPGFHFLRPDLYTAVSDPCLQVRHGREGTKQYRGNE